MARPSTCDLRWCCLDSVSDALRQYRPVLPQPGVATTSRIPIDIRRFPWIRPLVADYAFDYAKVADFFAGDPGDQRAWRDAIDRSQQHPRNRAAIADIVQAQQRRRGAPAEAVAAAARLRDTNTVAVVTGQQPDCSAGPLFTVLKAIPAIRLAEDCPRRNTRCRRCPSYGSMPKLTTG